MRADCQESKRGLYMIYLLAVSIPIYQDVPRNYDLVFHAVHYSGPVVHCQQLACKLLQLRQLHPPVACTGRKLIDCAD